MRSFPSYWRIGVGLSLFVLAGYGIVWYYRALNQPPQHAIYLQTVVVEPKVRDKFFETVTQFAKQEGFAVRIAPVHPNNEQFSIGMERADFSISAGNTLNRSEFRVFYYMNKPTKELRADLARLVTDFENVARSVETVTVSTKEDFPGAAK